jgi:hypothetical protein
MPKHRYPHWIVVLGDSPHCGIRELPTGNKREGYAYVAWNENPDVASQELSVQIAIILDQLSIGQGRGKWDWSGPATWEIPVK